ncbi:MAG TPA: cytochrome b/b6 domain-containing protein, partial [Methylomirabilota bacterium]|nr:cytochrome b/b6 domain-containing protein [Methylomirabilota bacterium]
MLSGFLYWSYNSWGAWGLGWLSLPVVAAVHLAGGFAILSFLIVHLYMITTGHSLSAHTRAMICGWEEVEERGAVEEWEIKRRVSPAEATQR